MTDEPKTKGKKGPTAAFLAQAGKGRPKGVPNKTTMKVKEQVLEALDRAGGVDYLVGQAKANPVAFMGMVSKIIPQQVGADPDSPPIDWANAPPQTLAWIAGQVLPDDAETTH